MVVLTVRIFHCAGLYTACKLVKQGALSSGQGPVNRQAVTLPAGVYIIGCQRLFSADNNIVISRMVDGSEVLTSCQLTCVGRAA